MISARFVPALCVLVAVALVPTWIHSYSGAVTSEGVSAAAIPSMLVTYTGTPTDRNENWGKRRFESDDWVERNYTNGRREVRVTVVRSYDHKTLYHHPELAVAYGPSFRSATTEILPERPEIPIHVLRPGPGADTVALYILRYQDRFIDDPLWFQIRTAAELLFSPRRAMTLFFATETGFDQDIAPLQDLASTAVLLSAVDGFVAQSAGTDRQSGR